MGGTFVITLREGFEAALILGIVYTYLQKIGAQRHYRYATRGGLLGVLASIALGVVVTALSGPLLDLGPDLIGLGVIFVAVVVLTWHGYWMRQHARAVKGDVQRQIDEAQAAHRMWIIGVIAFTGVFREGAETVLFMWGLLTQATSTSGWASALGAVLGLIMAASLGWAIFRGGRHVSLQQFFGVTSIFLLLLAAARCGIDFPRPRDTIPAVSPNSRPEASARRPPDGPVDPASRVSQGSVGDRRRAGGRAARFAPTRPGRGRAARGGGRTVGHRNPVRVALQPVREDVVGLRVRPLDHARPEDLRISSRARHGVEAVERAQDVDVQAALGCAVPRGIRRDDRRGREVHGRAEPQARFARRVGAVLPYAPRAHRDARQAHGGDALQKPGLGGAVELHPVRGLPEHHLEEVRRVGRRGQGVAPPGRHRPLPARGG